ncbi:MAG: hypothetical protein HFJ35_07250 [Clostridia bacterium]|nr:hypothetical protein [Clostridia bacterium]
MIALVITIIVLLILVAISISTLIGENGILTKVRIASEDTKKEVAKEKVQMAVLASYGTDGRIDINQLNENLAKVEGIEGFKKDITEKDLNDGVTVIVDGYNVTIYGTGEITVNKGTDNPPIIEESQLEKAIKSGNVLDTNKPIIITDKYGNEIKVPEGFKIASDSATDVTGGVVIEDATSEPTKGSQFVWIPVGTIYTSFDKSAHETIELNRYTFHKDEEEKIVQTAHGEKAINYYQELETSSYGNTTAKSIKAFQQSVVTNGGYYIGRYEARTPEETTQGTENNELGQVTVKANDYVYDATQTQAAKLSGEMYGIDKTFTSDLVNSYAWDTTLVFIQTFGTNDYTDKYISNSKGWGNKGSNNLDKVYQDKECNVWDMMASKEEWTTETHFDGHVGNGTIRSSVTPVVAAKASERVQAIISNNSRTGFRVILYF